MACNGKQEIFKTLFAVKLGRTSIAPECPSPQGGADDEQKRVISECGLSEVAVAGVKSWPRSPSVEKAERALVSSQNPYWSVVTGVRIDDSGDKAYTLIPFRSLLKR
jgi:hypothetical protein